MVGYHAPGAPHVLGKSVLAAFADKAYEVASSHAPEYPVVVAHLRKASSGSKSLENTHPFTMGPWTFAHNGTIYGDYAERMAPGMNLNDSRAFFLRTHEHLRSDPIEALRRAVTEVRERGYSYSSITGILTDGAKLYAIRDVRKSPDEYAMHWQTRGGRVVFCQEQIGAESGTRDDPGAWQEVPNGHVAVAVRGRDVELVAL
jgi:glutamine amidotransferase